MTIFEYSEKHGARKCAIELVNRKISALSGGMLSSLSDLPDTSEVCDILDSLEDAIKGGDMADVKEVLSEVDDDFVGRMIWD